jgi:signal transduction histidine kinase
MLTSRAVADHKKVQLDLEGTDNLPVPPLDLDPVKIFHALDSLLTSTIKLVRPGSKLRVSVRSRSGRVTISLRAEGSGVSPETLRSLFHPLRTGRMNPSGIEVGTVLGLAKIRRIVAAHGGTIRVERGEENEFLIRVTFPLPQRTTAHRSAAGIG